MGALNKRCRIIIGTQKKGTIILTTTHVCVAAGCIYTVYQKSKHRNMDASSDQGLQNIWREMLVHIESALPTETSDAHVPESRL